MDRDWMPTTQPIERVSGRSQEREFSMQRQGNKISDFGTYSTAETAQTKKQETHVFDNSSVLRVSLPDHNYREWVVGAPWLEPGTRCLRVNRSPQAICVTAESSRSFAAPADLLHQRKYLCSFDMNRLQLLRNAEGS
jgi:hypothetical protein